MCEKVAEGLDCVSVTFPRRHDKNPVAQAVPRTLGAYSSPTGPRTAENELKRARSPRARPADALDARVNEVITHQPLTALLTSSPSSSAPSAPER
jgi:hypothetical protein